MKHHGKILGSYNGVQLIECFNCALIHQHPLPDVKEYYENDQFYTEHSPSDWFEKVAWEHRAGYWNPAYQYQYDILTKRHMSSYSLMDVGCGAGWFLQFWAIRFLRTFIKFLGEGCLENNVIGIEPSALAKERAPAGVKDYIYSSIPEYLAGTTEWNVRMSLVLEHIPDPVNFLSSYVPFLGKHGKMMIIVPNEFSSLQERLGTYHFVSGVHMNYFAPESLRYVIEEAFSKHNLSIRVDETATFPMELFQVMGIKYIGDDALGRKCHMFRLKFEKLFKHRAFDLYRKLYKRYGWGRELIFIASIV